MLNLKDKLKTLVPLLVGLILIPTSIWAKGVGTGTGKTQKKGGNSILSTSQVRITVNKMAAYLKNNAKNFQDPNGGEGVEYPYGSGGTTCFLLAPWFACYYNGDPSDIRTSAVADASDGTEFQPGKILSPGKADDPTLPRYRVFVIRRGHPEDQDYKDWPFDDGAPYLPLKGYKGQDSVDASGVPVPDLSSGTKVPYVQGDVTSWCVYNDLRPTREYSANPNNLEIQQTVFGFASTGELGNMLFLKFKIINKGTGNLKKSYFAVFTDSDIGANAGDHSGCDTLLSLGYNFNGSGSDPEYGTTPPAFGIAFFKGPKVKGSNGQYLKRPDGSDSTLGLTAFVRFNNPSLGPPSESDPNSGRPDQVYNFLTGRNQLGQVLGGAYPGSNFMFPGNPELPVSTTNLIEDPGALASGTSGNPIGTAGGVGDKRQLTITGPFDLSPGESQEIIVAALDRQGSNYRNSVTALKGTAKVSKAVFDANFNVASPTSPALVATANLVSRGTNGQVILNWNDNRPRSITNSDSLESANLYDPQAVVLDSASLAVPPTIVKVPYVFEGYNVYEYTSAAGDGKKLVATYDVVDGIKKVYDNLSSDAANPNLYVSANGTDAGIQRSLILSADPITNSSFVSGRNYYFSVTSYYVNKYELQFKPYAIDTVTAAGVSVPGFQRPVAAIKESFENIQLVTVQPPPLGTTIPASTGQTVATARTAGGDKNVTLTVIDPSKVTGDTYKVLPINSTTWSVTSSTRHGANGQDSVYISNSTTLASGSAGYPVVDGIQVSVTNGALNGALQAEPNGAVYTPASRLFLQPIAPSNPSSNFNVNPARRLQYFGNQVDPRIQNTTIAGFAGVAGVVWYPAKSLYDKDVSLRRDYFGRGSANGYDNLTTYGATVHTGATTASGQSIGTSVSIDNLKKVYLVFDTTANGGQYAYRYGHVTNLTNASAIRGYVATDTLIANAPAPVTTTAPALASFTHYPTGTLYDGMFIDSVKVPFKAYKIDPTSTTNTSPVQINVAFMETNDKFSTFDGKWDPNDSLNANGALATGGGEPLYILLSEYNSGKNLSLYTQTTTTQNLAKRQDLYDIQYIVWGAKVTGVSPKTGDTLAIYPNFSLTAANAAGQLQYTWSTADLKATIGSQATALARGEVNNVSVYPNPYFGTHSYEKTALEKFVTFNHLPPTCTIKIFTLSGELVKTIVHNNPTSTLDKWDLTNSNNVNVASGMYILYVDAPGYGTKVLKLAVIMRQTRIDTFN